MKKKFYLVFIPFLFVLFVSVYITIKQTEAAENEEFLFYSQSQQDLDPQTLWAVVRDPYAAERVSPSYEAEVCGHYRKGAVLQVIGESDVKIDESWEKWYAFEEGWIQGSALDISSNRLRAEAVSKKLLDKES